MVELDLARVGEAPVPDGVEVHAFTECDRDGLAAAAGGRTIEWLRRWVPRGLRGFVAVRDGRVVGHGWYATHPVPQPHLYPDVPPADAIVLPWVWVAPSERGRGIGSALLRARAAEARRAGFRRAWSAIRTGNDAPIRELGRVAGPGNLRLLGEVTLLRVLGIRRRTWRAVDAGSTPAPTVGSPPPTARGVLTTGLLAQARLRRLASDARLARQKGALGFLRWLAGRLSEPVFLRRRYRVFEQDLARVTEASPPVGVEIRAFAERDWDALAAATESRALAWLRRWIPTGLRGFVAVREGRLIGQSWYATRPVPQRYLYPQTLPGDTVVVAWVWVAPAERGHGIGSALLRACALHARTAGFGRALYAVTMGHGAAVRERAAGGKTLRLLGVVTIFRVAGFRRRTRRVFAEDATALPRAAGRDPA